MSQFIQFPSAGTPAYANIAALPSTAANGSLAVTTDTYTLWVFDGGLMLWQAISAPSAVLNVGIIDSIAPSAQGGVINSNSLIFQSASVTVPGLVNNTTQSFSGNKTFTGTIGASNLSGTNTGDVTISTANGLSLLGQALSLALSSGSTTGALSSTDWNTFNSKQAALTPGNISTATTGVSVTNGSSSTVGPNVVIDVQTASGSQPGLLSAADWTTFNSKQPAGSYITALTSDVSASGPGSAAATVNSVGGSSAAAVNTAAVAVAAATSLETANTLIMRDATAGFKAGKVQLLSDTIQFGTQDAFARNQILNNMTNNILRLGTWQQDGDATSVVSEGIVTFGNGLLGTPLSSSGGSYARIKNNRYGLFTVEPSLPFYAGGAYYFRIDDTQMYYKDNSGNTTFSVQRTSGNTTVRGTLAVTSTISASNLSGTNTGDVTLGTANGLSLVGQALSLGLSSSSTTGALSSTDWSTFNSKQAALTPGNISTSTTGVTVTNGSSSTVGPNVAVDIQTASGSQPGLLSAADWTTFNSKQAAGSYITALTSDVTASGPGSAVATIANGAVSNAKMANMAANTIKGNNTGLAAAPIDLTTAQATAMLDVMVGDSGTGGTKGLVPAAAAGDAAAGKFLKADGTFAVPPNSGGTVTTVSVVSANGLAGSVANATTTPAITLSTTITGILKGNGTAISAASAGTDYQAPLTFGNLTEATSSVLTILGGTGAVIGSGASIQVKLAGAAQDGYLSSADWNTFNGKQAAGSYITALTSDVTASGPGSATATIAANAVTDSKFRQSAALSLVGNATNATANVADISAATDNTVFRRSGTAIGFGAIDLSQSNTVGSSILGVANGGTGQSSFTNGQLLIGNTTGNTLTKATLTAGSGISITNGTGSITIATANPATSAISASDIDWSSLRNTGGLYTKTLGANTTFTFSNTTAGQTIIVRLTNTASNYTVTWPTVKWSGGSTPTMTTGAKSDIYTFVYDGTDIFGSAVQNF